MKNIKNSYLLGLVAIVFAINIVAMRNLTPQQIERVNLIAKRKKQYFIHEQDNPTRGIWVDKKLAIDNSQSIKNMVEDFGEELNDIPLPCSVDIIKLGFGVLGNTIDINTLSSEQLIDVANLFNFLDVPAAKMQTVLAEIQKNIKSDVKGINERLKPLHPDLQKLIMTDSVITDIKGSIIKKYAKNRGKSLVGHPMAVVAVAVSPDGTKIVSGCEHGTNNLILWDISDPGNITPYPLVGHPWSILSVAFSPDGKQIISSSGTHNNNLILWNISDLNNITHRAFGVGVDFFKSLAFSPDGKKIFSCGNNFIVWDISNPENITHQQLLTDLRNFSSVFSPDGTLLASGEHHYLTIKDISGSEVVEYKYKKAQELKAGEIYKLVFSPDGKNVISCGDKLILWDISDLNNITAHVLPGIFDFGIGGFIAGGGINSMVFSHDGKKIALGHNDGFILFDIKNPHNASRIDKFGIVLSMAFSPDDNKIVTGGRSGILIGKNLYLWTLITNQEKALVNQIKNYNADQTRLIYQLCLQSSYGQTIELKKGSEEEAIFMTLPDDMQKLLTDLFLPQSFFSGWWR